MSWEERWQDFRLQDRSAYRARMLDELSIDPARTAVVTIDMQYNYLDPEVGGLPVLAADAEHVVKSTERILDVVRGLGIPVIHAYTVRRQVEIDRGFMMAGVRLMQAGIRNKVSQLPHSAVSELPDRLAGSRQAQVVESLVHPDDLHVTTKRTMDPFQYTELDLLLARVYRADTVILTGINTDTCVYSATFTAANRGYQPVVVSDCVASTRGPDSHLMALEVMSRSIAWVLTVDQLEAKLRG
jgi:biuret amidohydrolase